MGLEPQLEAPHSALQLLASSFLVVLAEAASLREFLDLFVLLWPKARLQGHLLCTWSHPLVVFCAWPYILLDGLRPLPENSLRALWLPARLLWPSLRPRVYESSSLSPWFFPFRGPTPISRLFFSLRPHRSHSPIPSLAPSWWSPCPLMRWALLTLSGYVLSVPSAFSLHRSRLLIPFAMSPLLRRVFADGISPLRAVALAERRLPMRWVPSEPMGFAVAPPISPYTGPGQSPRFCRMPFGAQVGVSYFSCTPFRMYLWRSFCQFNWLIRVPA